MLGRQRRTQADRAQRLRGVRFQPAFLKEEATEGARGPDGAVDARRRSACLLLAAEAVRQVSGPHLVKRPTQRRQECLQISAVGPHGVRRPSLQRQRPQELLQLPLVRLPIGPLLSRHPRLPSGSAPTSDKSLGRMLARPSRRLCSRQSWNRGIPSIPPPQAARRRVTLPSGPRFRAWVRSIGPGCERRRQPPCSRGRQRSRSRPGTARSWCSICWRESAWPRARTATGASPPIGAFDGAGTQWERSRSIPFKEGVKLPGALLFI